MEKDGGEINDKLLFHMKITMQALELKNDIPKFYKFINDNSKYFPGLTKNNNLEKLKVIAEKNKK